MSRNRRITRRISPAHAHAEWEKRKEANEDALAESLALDVSYAEAAKFDERMHAAWRASLGGRCCQCGEPAPPEDVLCVACHDAM